MNSNIIDNILYGFSGIAIGIILAGAFGVYPILSSPFDLGYWLKNNCSFDVVVTLKAYDNGASGPATPCFNFYSDVPHP